jgi:dihydroorotase
MKLLIQNGRIWDGKRYFFADVLTEDKNIKTIASHIEEKADFTFDASGMIVTAGLVDMHMHMQGISSDSYAIDPSAACFPFGVTAACDAGGRKGSHGLLSSFGVKSAVFAEAVIENDSLNEAATACNIALFGDKVVGVKLFYDVGGGKLHSLKPLQEVCDFAHSRGLKVMVHCNHSPTSMLSIVEELSSGDVLSHVYHGGCNDCTEGEFAALKLAREKGVILDAAFAGHVHTDFSVLQKAFAAKQFPDTISTDITKSSAYKRGGRYGLTMCMSMARTAGMAEEAIFRAVTSVPARALGQAWGALQVGGVADIAVLDYTEEPFCLTDKAGNTLQSSVGYRCKLTVADGVVVFKD